MDIDASWKSWILVQKASRCLNLLCELIYFLVTVSIFSFRKHLSRNWTWKNSLHAPFMLPQNFGTKFEIQKKVLNACWPNLNFFWTKVFSCAWAHFQVIFSYTCELKYIWMDFHSQIIILVRSITPTFQKLNFRGHTLQKNAFLKKRQVTFFLKISRLWVKIRNFWVLNKTAHHKLFTL